MLQMLELSKHQDQNTGDRSETLKNSRWARLESHGITSLSFLDVKILGKQVNCQDLTVASGHPPTPQIST